MREHGLFFDHNLHALRIVEDFEMRYAAFRGLNLTFEVREGIIKHSRDYEPSRFPELAEYLLELRPPLEAQLIDVTDEIAYSTADLDDGFEAHLLDLDRITEAVPVFAKFFSAAKALYPDAPKKLQFNEALRQILDRWVGDVIQNTKAQVQRLATAPADQAITLDRIRAHPKRLVGLSEEMESERRKTKEFLYQNLYFSSTLEPEKQDAERVITELFDLWMKDPGTLPMGYQEKSESEPLARVICDYIAGMTDNFIYEQHEKYCA
jgi:dGTPase